MSSISQGLVVISLESCFVSVEGRGESSFPCTPRGAGKRKWATVFRMAPQSAGDSGDSKGGALFVNSRPVAGSQTPET